MHHCCPRHWYGWPVKCLQLRLLQLRFRISTTKELLSHPIVLRSHLRPKFC